MNANFTCGMVTLRTIFYCLIDYYKKCILKPIVDRAKDDLGTFDIKSLSNLLVITITGNKLP